MYFDFITTVCIGKKQTMFLKLFNIAIFQLDLSAVILISSHPILQQHQLFLTLIHFMFYFLLFQPLNTCATKRC